MKKTDEKCPACGYCPHCGRSDQPAKMVPYPYPVPVPAPRPIYPRPYGPYWQIQPTWIDPARITCSPNTLTTTTAVQTGTVMN